MAEAFLAIEQWATDFAGSPWLLVVVFLLATIDGFFPPVPSESVVISVAVLAMTGAGPNLWLLIAAAAAGAICGDLIAYTIGSKIPVDRIRPLRSPRGQRTIARARRALAARGTLFILSARFVPIGRVAVNMTAGVVGYRRRRFVVIAAVAGLFWAGYSTVLGIGAGVALQDHPIIAVVVGVIGGVLIGLALEAVLRRLRPHSPVLEDEVDADARTA
ncbi:MAG TPA: VTT domain-containing protein [Actinomycetaceae bacterium]|nr:VTT domain-containing protein [Actinomycetaceae bacterium]